MLLQWQIEYFWLHFFSISESLTKPLKIPDSIYSLITKCYSEPPNPWKKDWAYNKLGEVSDEWKEMERDERTTFYL